MHIRSVLVGLVLLACQSSFIMQASELLKQVWVVPCVGAYSPIECPTYVTDTIYFKGKADLCGGSYMTQVTDIVKDGKTITLDLKTPEGEKLFINTDADDGFHGRHPRFTYWYEEGDLCVKLKFCVKKQDEYYTKKEDGSFEFAYKGCTAIENCGKKVLKLFTDGTYTILDDCLPPTTPYDRGAFDDHLPHTECNYGEFQKNNKWYEIKEERLSIPIINLILGDVATFLIRYHAVELLQRNGPSVERRIDKICTIRNALRAVNGMFLLGVFYMGGSWIYKNTLQ